MWYLSIDVELCQNTNVAATDEVALYALGVQFFVTCTMSCSIVAVVHVKRLGCLLLVWLAVAAGWVETTS